jgi:F-type H+-transporting ATPase subunit a
MRPRTRLLALAGLAALFFTGCVELDVNELFFWDPIALEGSPFAFNRVALLTVFASIVCMAFFFFASRKKAKVPGKLQNIAETGYLFVRNSIAIDTIGPEGAKYANYLASVFFFVFFLNLLEIIPGINFPVPSRMAIPAMLALLTYLVFNIVGIVKQGPWRYFKDSIWFPEAPIPIRILLAFIELISIFIFRPLTLAIRLLANMMAGHVLLTIFFLFTNMFLIEQFPSFGSAMGIVTLLVACALILFELLVIFIQAYIFTMLTAFYIAESTHGHGDHDEEHEVKHEETDAQPTREVEGLATA